MRRQRASVVIHTDNRRRIDSANLLWIELIYIIYIVSPFSSISYSKMTTHQCDCFVPANDGPVWRPDYQGKPTPARPGATELYRPDILEHIEATIKDLDKELRELSLEIHSMPSFQIYPRL
jgi:hypothetical protein